jgi:transposase
VPRAQIDAVKPHVSRQVWQIIQLQILTGARAGPRLAEIVVATLGDPHRLKSRRGVAAYAGLVPRRFKSGTMSHQGRITGAGQKLLRCLLVEVGWMMKQHNPALYQIAEKTMRGSETRKKVAIAALAQRLLNVCEAM